MRAFYGTALGFIFAFTACAHSGSQTQSKAEVKVKESGTATAIRKRAAFDLSCPEEQIQVAQIEAGTLFHVATYGATCGDKRVSYVERMGNIVKQ